MREQFPRAVVRVLVAAFALSLFGLLSWFAYFALRAPRWSRSGRCAPCG